MAQCRDTSPAWITRLCQLEESDVANFISISSVWRKPWSELSFQWIILSIVLAFPFGKRQQHHHRRESSSKSAFMMCSPCEMWPPEAKWSEGTPLFSSFHSIVKAKVTFLDTILFQVNESWDLQAAVFRDTLNIMKTVIEPHKFDNTKNPFLLLVVLSLAFLL